MEKQPVYERQPTVYKTCYRDQKKHSETHLSVMKYFRATWTNNVTHLDLTNVHIHVIDSIKKIVRIDVERKRLSFKIDRALHFGVRFFTSTLGNVVNT